MAIDAKAACFKVTNNGSATMVISSIRINGDFSATTTCPQNGGTLTAGTSCTITASFKPSATGTRTGTITISDNAGNSPQTITLTGTGGNSGGGGGGAGGGITISSASGAVGSWL